MRVRRTILTAAFGASVAVSAVVGAAGVAHAEKATFVNPDYVGAETVVGASEVSQPAVLGETVTSGDVIGEQQSRGELPLTGGDTVGLSAAGLAMVGAGVVLVRRSRRRA